MSGYGYKPLMTLTDTSKLRKAVAVKDLAVLTFVIVIFILLNHAGSLIAAPAAAIGGLFGIIGHRLPGPRRWPVAVWIGLMFLAWCALSAIWSPWEPVRDLPGVLRFCTGLPLYGLLIAVMAAQTQGAQRYIRLMIMTLLTFSAFLFAVDFVSNFALYNAVAPNANPGDRIQNLSHGLSVLLICLPPVSILLLRHGRGGVMMALALSVLTAIAALNSGNSASVMALPAIAVFMAAAYKFPKATLQCALMLPIAVILLAPIISIIAAETGQATKDALPFSWEWRTETWGYLSGKIMDNPIVGNGFDSLRTMKDTFEARGFDGLSLVPLHAHNFGLHLWVEVGLIGAILASLFFWKAATAIRRSSWLTPRRASALCGSLIAIVIFSSLSYSAWQDWWWGAIAFALSFATLIPGEEK